MSERWRGRQWPRIVGTCRLLGTQAAGTFSGGTWAGRGLPFRDVEACARHGQPHTLKLPPVYEAPAGFVIVGAHPHGSGVIASYRQQFHAVVEPSDEATVLKVRLQGGAPHAAAPGTAPDHPNQRGAAAVESELHSGRMVQEPGGSGVWWRCMSKVTQQFPSPDGHGAVSVVALTLQQFLPDLVLRAEELRAVLAHAHGGVVVLLSAGCDALVKTVLAAGVAAVLVPHVDITQAGVGGGILAAADALMQTIRSVRAGHRLDLAMRESGSSTYFSLMTGASPGSVDLAG